MGSRTAVPSGRSWWARGFNFVQYPARKSWRFEFHRSQLFASRLSLHGRHALARARFYDIERSREGPRAFIFYHTVVTVQTADVSACTGQVL
jgi:hypothetical protein